MNTRKKIYNEVRTEGETKRRQIDPYEDLANAIVMRAVEDYRLLRSGRIPTIHEEQQLNMKPEAVIKTCWDQKQKIIKFFKSAWYGELTKVNATYMLETLDNEPVSHWKPTHKYVEVNPYRLEQEIKNRSLSNATLVRLTKVKSDCFFRIVRSKKVIIPVNRALKICDGLAIPKDEFIVRKILRGEV